MYRHTPRVSRFFKAALTAGVIAFAVSLTAPATATANPLYAAIVVDAKTGKTLFSRHADKARFPASITKVMTLYMLFEAIEQGRVKMSDRVVMSRHAASMPPSKLYIKAGRSISVQDAIKALVTKSANDVAAAVGEHLGGTESEFAAMMTTKARQLGMTRTTFRNASGLPNSGQKTTARDLARLGMAIREHFPKQFEVFKTRSFRYGKSTYTNHNRLLGSVSCVDGIKTGYIRASGFNLLASCTSGKRRIVAVVMGGRSGKTRNAHMAELIKGYVGKATRRRGQLQVRKPGATRFAALAPAIPPAPRSRPFAPVVVASAAPVVVPSAPVQASVGAIPQRGMQPNRMAKGALPQGSIYGETARIASAAMPADLPVATGGKGGLPSAAVARMIERAQAERPAPVQQVAAYVQPVAQPAAVQPSFEDGSNISGWVVQIAAVDDRARAVSMLANAQSQVAAVAHAQPFTMPIVKGGGTLWRARLAGFNGKDHAWKACEALTLQGIACYATTN
ncbi:MAG: serine hydrolase [Pseudomonadota bacterium]